MRSIGSGGRQSGALDSNTIADVSWGNASSHWQEKMKMKGKSNLSKKRKQQKNAGLKSRCHRKMLVYAALSN
jgi:hypothetical protein